jgi:hypothetical protein
MQSEAKRSRGPFSLQFAICRVIFINCRESQRCVRHFPNDFNMLMGVARDLGSREKFVDIAGKSSVELERWQGGRETIEAESCADSPRDPYR